MTKALVVEIENSSGNWADLTTSTKGVDGRIGWQDPKGGIATVGKCNILLDNSNSSRPYSPEVTTTNLKLSRRARVTYYGDSHGYCLRATRTGNAGGGGTNVINTSVNTDPSYDAEVVHLVSVNSATWWQVFEVERTGLITHIKWSTTGNSIPISNDILVALYAADVTNPDAIIPTGSALDSGFLLSPFSANTEYDIPLTGGTVVAQSDTKYVAWFYAFNNNDFISMGRSSSSTYPKGYAARAKITSVAPTPSTISSLIYYKDSDMYLKVVTTAIEAYFKQQVTNSFGLGDTWVLSWEARASTDTRWNSDDVYMVTSAQTQAATTYNYTAEWASYSLSYSPTLSATTIEVRFRANDANTSGNIHGIEYRNITLKKNGGSNVLTNGDFASGTTGWSAVDITGATTTLEAIRDYTYIFNGLIDSIAPVPFAYGALDTLVRCVDYVDVYQKAELTLALMQNQTASDIANAAIETLSPGKAIGTNFETGLTFVLAGDRYRKQKTKIYDVFKDIAMSQYGGTWVDRSGVLRLAGSNFFGMQPSVTPALTLSDSGSYPARLFEMSPALQSRENIRNKIIVTTNPRQTIATSILAQTQQVLQIPPKLSTGAPGTLKLTLEFRDSAGNPIGGDNVVTPPAATTDIQVWTNADLDTNTVSGTDKTSLRDTDWKDVYTVNATNVDVVFENYTAGNLYVASNMNIRGDGVIMYDPITITKTDADSIAAHQEISYSHDLPFYSNVNFPESLANYVLYRRADPESEISAFSVTQRSDLGSVDLLALDMFDVVAITDTQTGLAALHHQITAIEFEFIPGVANQTQRLTFWLGRMDSNQYLILDDATYGKLDTGRLYI